LEEVALHLDPGICPKQLASDLGFVAETGLQTPAQLSIHLATRAQENVDRHIAVSNFSDQTGHPLEPTIGGLLHRVALGNRNEQTMGHAQLPQVPVKPMERFGIGRAAVGTGPQRIFGAARAPGDLRPERGRFSRGGPGARHPRSPLH
jgi:hypothetical protein